MFTTDYNVIKTGETVYIVPKETPFGIHFPTAIKRSVNPQGTHNEILPYKEIRFC